MTTIEFRPWPKIARLNRDIIISEKLDGTNAAIQIVAGYVSDSQEGCVSGEFYDGVFYKVAAQSRNRIITAKDDNHGFAAWVGENSQELVNTLGPGTHFGEWWGRKIARGYDKTNRTFSLFNTSRWTYENTQGVDGLSVVPTLYTGPMSTYAINAEVNFLTVYGSQAAKGFMRPEGVVIFHTASNVMFKVTLENDDKPKGQS